VRGCGRRHICRASLHAERRLFLSS
jgi:hypothetical protein